MISGKSQGSEYPAVVIPVMTQHYAMMQRNLLYTGVTREKKLVVLVGQKKAVAIAWHMLSVEVSSGMTVGLEAAAEDCWPRRRQMHDNRWTRNWS